MKFYLQFMTVIFVQLEIQTIAKIYIFKVFISKKQEHNFICYLVFLQFWKESFTGTSTCVQLNQDTKNSRQNFLDLTVGTCDTGVTMSSDLGGHLRSRLSFQRH